MRLFDSFLGRREPRWFENGAAGARHGKFPGYAMSDGRKVPVLGTAIAHAGLAFVSPRPIAENELDVTFTLRERVIPSRVHVERHDAMQAPDRIVHRYFCTFNAIASDDWDAVVRYVDHKPEPHPVAAPKKLDDEFRSLPQAVQGAIVDHLVRMGRLHAPSPGTAPLIRMAAGRVRDLGQGRTAQDVSIHSRIADADATREYDTHFRVLSAQRVELLG